MTLHSAKDSPASFLPKKAGELILLKEPLAPTFHQLLLICGVASASSILLATSTYCLEVQYERGHRQLSINQNRDSVQLLPSSIVGQVLVPKRASSVGKAFPPGRNLLAPRALIARSRILYFQE